MAQVALTFALYRGEEFLRKETLTVGQPPAIKIGKDPRSHLRIDDEQASRMHAVIEVNSPSDLTIIDLGTELGTVVNGQRINKCKIRVGDQVQVGSVLIVLESADEVASMVPPPVSAAPSAPPPSLHSAPPMGVHEQETQIAPVGMSPANPFTASAPPAAANPFMSGPTPSAAPAAFGGYGAPQVDVDPHAAAGSYTYRLVKTGPDVPADEVEVPHVASVEVMAMWDSNVLEVKHLTPPRAYYVGEEIDAKGKSSCDFFAPEETLGSARVPVVLSRGGDAATVVWPRNANGTVEIPNQGKFFLQDLVSSGRARTSSEAPGGYEFDLVPGSKARVEFASGLTFQVSAVNAGKAIPVAWAAGIGAAGLMYVALSFLAHTGLFSAMAFFMPAMGADDSDALDRDQLLRMRHYLDAAAEREQEEKETPKDDNANADNKEGGTGTRAKGEEGSMGNPTTKATGHKYGIQGPQDNQDPHIARQAALKEAAEFGMIGLLNTGAGGDPNAPTAPWGREDSLGNDPMSARGNMWGDTIGDSFGAGGLGLSGVGEGGGGRGEGIGLGNIGTFGHGAGTGTGQGFGSGHGRLGGSHQTRAPSIRQGATTVNGRLPPEVIQRIVRQNFGRFKLCYEDGLRKNPSLQGRVAVKFVIDRSGAVSTAQD